EELADRGVAVGVGAAGHRDHRGYFGIAKCSDDTDQAGDCESEKKARPGLLRTDRSQHENSGADHTSDAEQGKLKPAKRSLERLPFGRSQNCVERLDTTEHAVPLNSARTAAAPFPNRLRG